MFATALLLRTEADTGAKGNKKANIKSFIANRESVTSSRRVKERKVNKVLTFEI